MELNGFDARDVEPSAPREVIHALFVLSQREAAHEDVRIRGAEAHGREREDGEAYEYLDEREAAASHLASAAGRGAQVRGSMGTMRLPLSLVTSSRTRSHVPSG